MNESDGLYIENIRVAPVDGIQTTYVGNDLNKPASLQTSFSQSFNLADSVAVRKLTRNAEQLDSGSRWPYTPHNAMIIEKGDTIFDGIAQMSNFSGGWEVELYEEKRDLLARLDRSLRTAKLDRLNHPWTIEEINARSQSFEGLCYPLIDYGLLKDGVIPPDTIFPAVYVKTIIDQMLSEEGYTLVGQLPTNELYKRLVIPFSESEPTSYDEQWQADRFARVTLDRPSDKVDRGTLGKGYWIDRPQPFDIDNQDTFYQGKKHNYNTSTHTYTCDTAMNLRVQATQIFKALCVAGGIEVILSVVKNGEKIENARFEAGAGYNILFMRTDRLSLNTTIKCKAGDRIEIQLEARRQTKVGPYRFEIFNDPDNAFAEFSPKVTTSTGDNWPVARNLPDITGVQLMVAMAYLFGGTWLVNKRRHQIKFSALSHTIDNTDNAVDWSDRLDADTQPKWEPFIEPYAQKNRLTWQEITETKKAGRVMEGVTLNYGDGMIPVNAPVLESDVALFEMPFAASTDSTETLPGYGSPPLVRIRGVSGKGDALSITELDTVARLLLVDATQSFPVKSTRFKDDGVTLETLEVNLLPCWFGNRPDVLIRENTQYNLCFSRLPINKGEKCIIDIHYEGLIRVLRRMRVLKVGMYLKSNDISQLDFTKPVRLKRVRVGPLVLSDGFYYLNRIDAYSPLKTCVVTLIAF